MTEIFVTQPVPERALSRLREVATVRVFPDTLQIVPYDRLREEVSRSDVLYCLLHDRVAAGLIGAGSRLRLIASSSITPAHVDVAAATARKIPVTHIPNIVADATADLQWGLLVATARRIVEADRALRRGTFPGAQSMHFVGGEIHGATLGTIGLGAIGSRIAGRARAFGMRVLYTKRHRLAPEEERQMGVEFRTLDALRARRIAGAGLDVYENEPQVHPGLRDLENVVLTPHIGSADRATRERIAAIVADNILAFLRGQRPPYVYNPQVFAGETS